MRIQNLKKNRLEDTHIKKHDVIEQLDGNNSSTDERYTESYWEREYMVTAYLTFLDAMEDIELANISLEMVANKSEPTNLSANKILRLHS